jgi:hypothetical protein
VPATRHPCTDAAADPGHNRPDASLSPTALAEPPLGAGLTDVARLARAMQIGVICGRSCGVGVSNAGFSGFCRGPGVAGVMDLWDEVLGWPLAWASPSPSPRHAIRFRLLDPPLRNYAC